MNRWPRYCPRRDGPRRVLNRTTRLEIFRGSRDRIRPRDRDDPRRHAVIARRHRVARRSITSAIRTRIVFSRGRYARGPSAFAVPISSRRFRTRSRYLGALYRRNKRARAPAYMRRGSEPRWRARQKRADLRSGLTLRSYVCIYGTQLHRPRISHTRTSPFGAPLKGLGLISHRALSLAPADSAAGLPWKVTLR